MIGQIEKNVTYKRTQQISHIQKLCRRMTASLSADYQSKPLDLSQA